MSINNESDFEWAGFTLPMAMASNHFCIVGSPGSGKTLLLRSLVQSVLRQISSAGERRAILFTRNESARAEFTAAGATCPMHVLNSFGSNICNWNLARDLTDESGAMLYAEILVPTDGDHAGSEFFTRAARAILSGVLQGFIAKNRTWTLQDVVTVSNGRENLSQFLSSNPQTAQLVNTHLNSEETFTNILAVLTSRLQCLKDIAATSANVPEQQRFSITDWHQRENSLLIVPIPSDQSAGLAILTKLFTNGLCEVLLGRQGSTESPTTWVFMDGVEELGRIDQLAHLLSIGRAKGVRVAMTVRDIEGLLQTYGDDKGWDLLSLCGNVSILRVTSEFTAQWASKLTSSISNFEYQPRDGGSHFAEQSFFQMTQSDRSLRLRRPYIAAEFLQLPLSMKGRVTGCHVLPALGGSILRETRHPIFTPPEEV